MTPGRTYHLVQYAKFYIDMEEKFLESSNKFSLTWFNALIFKKKKSQYC